jgi:nicotinamide mononucleotide transporter
MDFLIQPVIEYFSGTLGKIELAGTIFSIICVWLAAKHNQWTWFFGAIGVILFGYLFFQFGLYSDAGLQILFFLPMQVIGYWWWSKEAAKSGSPTTIKAMSGCQVMLAGVVIAAMTGFNGWILMDAPGVSFPFIDAMTTWMSIVAQILMIMKFRESWVLWATMDVVAIGVYFAKGLIVTSGLYVIFLVIASVTAYVWYRNYAKQIAE